MLVLPVVGREVRGVPRNIRSAGESMGGGTLLRVSVVPNDKLVVEGLEGRS